MSLHSRLKGVNGTIVEPGLYRHMLITAMLTLEHAINVYSFPYLHPNNIFALNFHPIRFLKLMI